MSETGGTAQHSPAPPWHADWRPLDGGLHAWFVAPSHAAAAALPGGLPEVPAGQRRDVDLRSDGVHVRLALEDAVSAEDPRPVGGLLAAQAEAISTAAHALGLVADASRLQRVSLRIESVGPDRLVAFWQAATGYAEVGADLADPLRRQPTLRLAPTAQQRPLRTRPHLDLSRALDLAAWTAATGGSADDENPDYLMLADGDGNEVDLVPGGLLADDPAVSDWRVLFGGMVRYRTGSPADAAAFARAVAALADDAGFALLIDLRGDEVVVDTAKDRWEDARFAPLAAAIQRAARAQHAHSDDAGLLFVQVGIDAFDVEAVRAFWKAALDYVEVPDPRLTDLLDPRHLGPPLFIQQMEEQDEARRRQRNRIQLVLTLPSEYAAGRVAAAVAAGGQVVEERDGLLVIADPEGNELTLRTDPPPARG